jgi:hypothetical protein
LIRACLADRKRRGSFDLEPVERLTRDVMHRCGALIVKKLLEHEDGDALGVACECGGRFLDKKREQKTLRTILGEIRVARTVQRCNSCGAWRIPADKVLDVERTGFSPGLRKLMARTGAEVCFERARGFLFDLAGVRVNAKDVERISEAVGADILKRDDVMIDQALAGGIEGDAQPTETLYIAVDGTGVPVLRRETEGRRGKAANGSARTREVKLGAIFSQNTLDDRGLPVREPASTSYVGRIESVEPFGNRLYAEALRRGLKRAGKVAMLGDGAVWVWNLANFHFPEAVQIVDFYHAAEHLGGIAHLLWPGDEVRRGAWWRRMRKKLARGKIVEIIENLGSIQLRGEKQRTLEKAVAYFEKNIERMRYDRFRQMGLFIGSGVIEAGCKSVIGGRLKRSGMHWSVRGADAIIALRCCLESGRFEDYWEQKCAA